MNYFLDFDRTLFDTDAYNASLLEEPGCAPFADELRKVLEAGRDDTLVPSAERACVWDKVSDAYASGKLSFPPGYLTRFVYSDVSAVLARLGTQAAIITYGERTRQQMKIESALPALKAEVLYTEDKSKAEFLAACHSARHDETIFVDDRVAELSGIAERFPAWKLYEMRRDGNEGDGRWSVIHSLAELP